MCFVVVIGGVNAKKKNVYGNIMFNFDLVPCHVMELNKTKVLLEKSLTIHVYRLTDIPGIT